MTVTNGAPQPALHGIELALSRAASGPTSRPS
jgi:hypothetical protein